MLKRPSSVLLVLAAFYGLLAAPESARACQCADQTVQAALEQSDAVFEGAVTTLTAEPGGAMGGDEQQHVVFRVSRAWKGVTTESVDARAWVQESRCGFHFASGEFYLVYATRAPEGLRVSACSRTKLAAEANADFADLGAGVTPVDVARGGDRPVRPIAPRAGGCAGCRVAPRGARSLHVEITVFCSVFGAFRQVNARRRARNTPSCKQQIPCRTRNPTWT